VSTFQKRRFWILENTGSVEFRLTQNCLNPGDQLTVTGFSTIPPEDGYGDEYHIK